MLGMRCDSNGEPLGEAVTASTHTDPLFSLLTVFGSGSSCRLRGLASPEVLDYSVCPVIECLEISV